MGGPDLHWPAWSCLHGHATTSSSSVLDGLCFHALRVGATTTLAANTGHVLAVAADSLTALLARVARLLGRKLVSGSFLVSGTAALARDFALTLGAYRSKPSRLAQRGILFS